MGTWGNGNFDSDTAADHLSILASRLLDETKAAIWGVAVPCNVELLALLAEQRWVGAMVPDLATVLAWKHTYLAIWEASIDGLEPDPKWRSERRAVIGATIDRLAMVSKREEPSATLAEEKPHRGRKANPKSKNASTAASKSRPKRR